LAKAIGCLSIETDLGFSVQHLSEKFPTRRNIPDAEWLALLAAEGNWIIISADKHIAISPHLCEAWRKSGLTAFFFWDWWPKLNRWQQASALFRMWPEIVGTARALEAGTGYRVPKPPGRFKVLR